MSILLGIAALFGIMFAMFSGVAGGEFSDRRRPRLALRFRPETAPPYSKVQLVLEGEGFEPDSQLRFVAWHLPDGHGFYHRNPVESERPYAFRSSSFENVAFQPAITLAPYTGEGEPHDVKVIATDDRGNSAECWISGKDFYLPKDSSVAR